MRTGMLILLFLSVLLSIGFEGFGKDIFILFIILSSPILWIERRTLYRDPVLWLLIAAIFSQVFSWLNSVYYFPSIALAAPNIDRLSKLFTFLFIAYWINGDKVITVKLLMTFSIGIILAVVLAPNFYNDVYAAMSGQRVDFSIKNAQFTSMFAGVAVLIHLFSYHWIRSNLLGKHRKGKIAWLFLNTMLLLTQSLLLFVSQSRQAWLGIAVVIVLAPIFLACNYKNLRSKHVIILYLLIAFAGLSLSQSNIVDHRFNKESSIRNKIIAGNWDNIPMSSFGLRFNSWLEASKWIKEHPIVGSSSEAIQEVIEKSPKFTPELKQEFGHLHNFHIETLVAYGVFGLLIIYGLYYWIIRSIILAQHKDDQLRSFTVFALMFLVYWLIVNFFETFSSRTYGVYTHNIIFGCLYTFYFASRLKTPTVDHNKS